MVCRFTFLVYTSSLRRIRSDFCCATVWNWQPSLPQDTSISTIPRLLGLPGQQNLLLPEEVFGTKSPIIPIIKLLRTLSYTLSPPQIATTNRLTASTQISALESALLSLNKPTANSPEPRTCLYSYEATPLKTAFHIYLYLVIREISPLSALLTRLISRLQDALELQVEGWWTSTSERRTWLLWMLFIGGAAAKGKAKMRWWFVRELWVMCRREGIWEIGGLRDALKRVVWQDEWCEEHCISLWNDLEAQGGLRWHFDPLSMIELDDTAAQL